MKALKLEDEKGYKKKNVEGDSNDQGQPKRKRGQKDYLSTMGFHGGTQYAQVKEFSPSIQDNNIDRYWISPGK